VSISTSSVPEGAISVCGVKANPDLREERFRPAANHHDHGTKWDKGHCPFLRCKELDDFIGRRSLEIANPQSGGIPR
jgi:hypothetical protein